MILVSCGGMNAAGLHDNVLIRGGYNIEDTNENYYDNGKGQPCKLSNALHVESSSPLVYLLDKNGTLWIESDSLRATILEPQPRINVPEEKRLRFIMQEDTTNSMAAGSAWSDEHNNMNAAAKMLSDNYAGIDDPVYEP
jgi:3-methyladenine DNA glycosylase Mpg